MAHPNTVLELIRAQRSLFPPTLDRNAHAARIAIIL